MSPAPPPPAHPASDADADAGAGAGDPGQALQALADAAVAEYKREAAGTPDPQVGTAFALGWQMSEIYRPDPVPSLSAVPGAHLPALADLGAGDWARIGLDQMQSGIAKLARRITAVGLAVPDAQTFARRLAGLTADGRDAAVEAFHVELLRTLTAADFRFGKAYGLGRALADSTRDLPGSNWRAELCEARVATLTAWLRELSTALPPHAGRVVAGSLDRWGRWAGRPAGDTAQDALDREQLLAQGRLWRSLVSGEKRPTEMLEMSDYVAAGESLLGETVKLVKPVVKHLAPLFAIVGTLVVVGVVLMIVTDSAAGIVSGAGVILAGLGVGWKSIGTRVGTAIAKLETPLWEASLDVAICTRITPQRVLDALPARPLSADEPSLTAATRAVERRQAS